VVGLPAVGTVILLDRGAFVGLVVPGDLFLALGGIYAGRHDLSIVAVIAVAFVAAIAGESVSFLDRPGGTVSAWCGISRWPNRLETKLDVARDYFTAARAGRPCSSAGTCRSPERLSRSPPA
jgi:membrane protein DedA with SNARE-associated domain